VRVRFLAVLASLAVLAGACGNVPDDAVATVNGEAVPYARFERIVAAQAEGIGLSGRDAEVAQRAFDAGVLDRAALDQALLDALGQEDGPIDSGPPLEVEQAFIDQLYDDQIASLDDPQQALSGIGVSEDRLREVFDRLVRFEVRGLQLNQGQTGFPIDRSDQLASLQQSIINQLVQAEIASQAVETLDLEVPEDAAATLEEQYLNQFGDEETLLAALEDAGYTRTDFEELFLGTQVNQQAIQTVEDPAEAQEFFDSLDVDVADRFGTWNTQQGQLVAPSNPV
jgi:hypothetical protein